MINPNTRHRWQSIAEQLGLPFEPSTAGPQEPEATEADASPAVEPPAATVEEPATTSVAPEPAAEQSPGKGRRRRGPSAEAEEAAPEVAPVIEETVVEAAAEPALDRESSLLGESEEGSATATESVEITPPREEGSPRGRRRRRGGRGGAREEVPAVSESDSADDEEVEEEATDEAIAEEATPGSEMPAEEGTAEERKRRRRGRGRKRRDREESPAAVADGSESVEEPMVEAASVEDEDANDGGEVDDLSNWNAPSWNDLIDSLYRPDR